MPQGAILSLLLFSIFMNDIPSASPPHGTSGSPNTNLFADDTSLYVTDKSFDSLSSHHQHDVDCISSWFDKWLLAVNTTKTASMVFRSHSMPAQF